MTPFGQVEHPTPPGARASVDPLAWSKPRERLPDDAVTLTQAAPYAEDAEDFEAWRIDLLRRAARIGVIGRSP